jgi:hypothetical protein
VLAAFYEMFDAGSDLIPFRKEVDSHAEIDVQAIQALH